MSVALVHCINIDILHNATMCIYSKYVIYLYNANMIMKTFHIINYYMYIHKIK